MKRCCKYTLNETLLQVESLINLRFIGLLLFESNKTVLVLIHILGFEPIAFQNEKVDYPDYSNAKFIYCSAE